MTRSTRLLTLILSFAAAIAASVVATGSANAAPPRSGEITSSVVGSFTDASGAPGTVAGTFDPSSFAARNGQLVATGELTTTLIDSAGSVLGTSTETISAAAAPLVAECDILNLVLGPLDLNLLGLEVHLDRVVLDITGVPGPGNLLGNLLCAVAGLFDGVGALSGIAALLNRILAVLGTLG